MKIIRGEKSADTPGVTQIQVDRKVVLSNRYMTLRRLWHLDLVLALLARFTFGFGTYLDVQPVHSRSLYILRPFLAPCTSYPAFSPRVPSTLLVSLWYSIRSFDCLRVVCAREKVVVLHFLETLRRNSSSPPLPFPDSGK